MIPKAARTDNLRWHASICTPTFQVPFILQNYYSTIPSRKFVFAFLIADVRPSLDFTLRHNACLRFSSQAMFPFSPLQVTTRLDLADSPDM